MEPILIMKRHNWLKGIKLCNSLRNKKLSIYCIGINKENILHIKCLVAGEYITEKMNYFKTIKNALSYRCRCFVSSPYFWYHCLKIWKF